LRRAIIALLLPALLTTACTDDRIGLTYRLEPGRRLEYRLVLRADIDRTLGGRSRQQRVEAIFLTSQEIVEAVPIEGGTARVTLVPRSLTVDGRRVDTGPTQGFTVELAPDGRVVALEEAAAPPSGPLDPVGLDRLLPRLSPVLPAARVRPGDTWRSDTEFTDLSGRFEVSTRSRLEQLGITGGHRAALVRTTYVTPVDRTEVLANAVARLTGRDVGVHVAWFSLDGFLVRSSGDSVARYRVTFHPPAGQPDVAPVQGALVVSLHTEMDLVAGS
jgi:hypothetical protein